MPKPTAPSLTATDTENAIQIGTLQLEIDQLKRARKGRSVQEGERIDRQISQRNQAQLRLYRGIHEESLTEKFDEAQKKDVGHRIRVEAARLQRIGNGLLSYGSSGSSTELNEPPPSQLRLQSQTEELDELVRVLDVAANADSAVAKAKTGVKEARREVKEAKLGVEEAKAAWEKAVIEAAEHTAIATKLALAATDEGNANAQVQGSTLAAEVKAAAAQRAAAATDNANKADTAAKLKVEEEVPKKKKALTDAEALLSKKVTAAETADEALKEAEDKATPP